MRVRVRRGFICTFIGLVSSILTFNDLHLLKCGNIEIEISVVFSYLFRSCERERARESERKMKMGSKTITTTKNECRFEAHGHAPIKQRYISTAAWEMIFILNIVVTMCVRCCCGWIVRSSFFILFIFTVNHAYNSAWECGYCVCVSVCVNKHSIDSISFWRCKNNDEILLVIEKPLLKINTLDLTDV